MSQKVHFPTPDEIAWMRDEELRALLAALTVSVGEIAVKLADPGHADEQWRIRARDAIRHHQRGVNLVRFTLEDRDRAGARSRRLEAVARASNHLHACETTGASVATLTNAWDQLRLTLNALDGGRR